MLPAGDLATTPCKLNPHFSFSVSNMTVASSPGVIRNCIPSSVPRNVEYLFGERKINLHIQTSVMWSAFWLLNDRTSIWFVQYNDFSSISIHTWMPWKTRQGVFISQGVSQASKVWLFEKLALGREKIQVFSPSVTRKEWLAQTHRSKIRGDGSTLWGESKMKCNNPWIMRSHNLL